jgi:uncharacterized protein Yka (UPF0111/DUF47 family)
MKMREKSWLISNLCDEAGTVVEELRKKLLDSILPRAPPLAGEPAEDE